jgi:hypothetical protein
MQSRVESLLTLKDKVSEWCKSAFLGEVIVRPGCSDEELSDLEATLSNKLPDGYRIFLKNCRELRADGVGHGIHLFNPYLVANYVCQDSTPNRLVDTTNFREVSVITIGIREDMLVLLGVGRQEAGTLWKWEPGEEVRFDGSADKGYEEMECTLLEILDQVIVEWKECITKKEQH